MLVFYHDSRLTPPLTSLQRLLFHKSRFKSRLLWYSENSLGFLSYEDIILFRFALNVQVK